MLVQQYFDLRVGASEYSLPKRNFGTCIEDSHTRMAHVEWSAGIDSVSGALSKPGKNGQHSCAKMLLGTHRVAATENPNCNRLYLRKKVERSTAPSTRELYARVRFAQVAAAVSDRSKDLSKITNDQQAFIAQKDLAGGKKTLKAWYWMVEGQAYDQEHQRS